MERNACWESEATCLAADKNEYGGHERDKKTQNNKILNYSPSHHWSLKWSQSRINKNKQDNGDL